MIRQVDERLRITGLRIRGWSSFGPTTPRLDLKDMNVLIGPNGAGKSNLIDTFKLLQMLAATSKEHAVTTGGVSFWKGAADREGQIEVSFGGSRQLTYRLTLGSDEEGVLHVLEEELREDREALLLRSRTSLSIQGQVTDPALYDRRRTVLSQFRDPARSPELTLVGDTLRAIRLHRQWSFGPHCPLRGTQQEGADSHLLESLANFHGVLRRVMAADQVKPRFMELLREFYPDAEDLEVRQVLGLMHLVVRERGYDLPAQNMSDGTLRWIFLLTVLLDPTPPPMVCLEEPELGLHPDIIPMLARLLKEASERTQLVIATHSGGIVDEFSDDPESVVVCERESGSTTLRRLDRADLAEWLKDYRLGLLWARGHLGGNRW